MTNAVSLAQGASNNTTFRNRIINGAMVIDQRNAGSSVTPTTSTAYTMDRWGYAFTQASKASIQQNAGSVTPPTGFTKYFGFTSLSAYSVLSSDLFTVLQPIEGYNIADLAWGTASAQSVTLSFWVRSSLTGTFGGSLANSDVTRSYPFTYTISAANTWEQKSITVAGETTGTWLTTNGVGIYVRFGVGVGSTYSGTAGSWASTDYRSATGATSVVGTSGATFYITGVQLEKGTAATPFEQRLYGTELQLCQRYYEILGRAFGCVITASTIWFNVNGLIPKRTDPTLTLTTTTPYGESPPANTARNGSGSTLTTHDIGATYASGWVSGFSGMTAFQPAFIAESQITASAEL